MLEKRDHNSSGGDVRDRSLQLFSFLREFLQLQLSEIRSIDSYIDSLWLKDIPTSEEAFCLFNTSEQDAPEDWITLKRSILEDAPTAPDKLAVWLDPDQQKNSKREYPELLEQIFDVNAPPVEGSEPSMLQLDSVRSEIQPMWETYVEKEWWPWAKRDRVQRSSDKLFKQLFQMYQRQSCMDSLYETVIGFGFLYWNSGIGQLVKHHAISARASIYYDAGTETLSVRPAGGGPQITLEPVLENHPVQWDFSDIREELKLLEDLMKPGSLDSSMERLATILGGNGEYIAENDPAIEPGSAPVIRLAPALILRRKLPSKATIHMVNQIIQDLETAESVPPGIENLMLGLEGQNAQGVGDNTSAESARRIVYYPLAANQDQLSVVKELDRSSNIVVDAPPGTGKTQTIANLLCHLLAQGKRVLVTSKITANLSDLLARLPEEFGSLRAPLLKDKLTHMHELEEVIQNFVEQHDAWSSEDNKAEIEALEEQHKNLLEEQNRLIETMEGGLENAKVHGTLDSGAYEGTPQEIIKRLQEESEYFDWFPDVPDEDVEPPLSNTEAVEFVLLLRQISPEKEALLGRRLVDPAQLMKTEDFTRFKEIEDMARDKNDEFFNNKHNTNHPILSKSPTEMRDELLDALSKIMDTYQLLNQHVYGWIKTAAIEILNGGVDKWRNLAQETTKQLDYIRTRIPAVADIRVSGLGEHTMRESKIHAIQLYEYLKTGGKIGSGPFRPKLIKETAYITRDVLIDGIPVTDEEQLQPLIVYLDIADRLSILTTMWQEHTELPNKAPIQIQFVEFENLFKTLLRALELDSFVYAFRTVAVQIDGFEEPVWNDFESLDSLRTSLLAINLEENAQRPFVMLGRILWNLRPDSEAHPIIKSMLTAVKNRDHMAYERRMRKLERAWQLQQQLQRRTEILDKMSEYCPKLLQSILVSYESSDWDSRVSRFTAAWEWARLNTMYKASDLSVNTGDLEVQLEKVQREIAENATHISAKSASFHCFSNLAASTQQSIREWAAAAKFMAKQTENVSHLHRKAYRENIQVTTSAIPAWILPMHRIPEVLPVEQNYFDVAIIDEANLTGPEGLLLAYFAEKLVTFGDIRHISAANTPVLEEGLDKQLHNIHLEDFPSGQLIGEEHSFYDLVHSFANKPIEFREHFRCHAEIIDFSNQLSYISRPQVPLRQPDAFTLLPALKSERIYKPSIQVQDSGIINDSEIEAIVARIKECLEDETYLGKTFGVIALDSCAQAQELESRILDEIGIDIFTERELICGTVEDCAGQERDVVFISLVAGTNQLQPALTGEAYQRTFNSLLISGREQAWIFHSMGIEHLDKHCLRYQLIHYLQNPGQHFSDHASTNMGELITKANISLQTRSSLPAPFVSWLQIEVFHQLAERDYSAIPGVFIGDYFADIVIESPNGCIVLECFSNDQASTDTRKLNIGKQRRLERLGWSFWQIKEDVYAEKGASALDPLWLLLQALNIQPLQHILAEDDSHPQISRRDENAFSPADYLNGSEYNGLNGNGHSLDDDSAPELHQFSAEDLQTAIMRSLSQSPKHSCPKDELPARVCLLLDIHPDDKVMRNLEKHVNNVLLHMEEEGIISGAGSDDLYVYLLDASNENSREIFNGNPS
ncbi:MAG: AAA domain-containing protein [Calditrichia bacterium]